MNEGADKVKEMVARVARGEMRALARAISMVEDGGAGARELLTECAAVGRQARRIGVTGPPGAGKSTLVDQMVRWLRARGERVGVVAVDPTSPYSGGALLGDRIRMNGFAGDEGVYIRSMASRGAVGGVARGVKDVCAVMEAAGLGPVVIETVGVGQDEVEIAQLAEVTVLVLTPGMGDEVQSLKAGVMEIADIYVVNKSDLPGADAVEREIVAMQGLGEHGAWVAPVVRTVAQTGEGVGELMEAIARFANEARVVRVGLTLGMKIDHLGIAVKSLDAAREFYELLGLRVGTVETVEGEQVRVAMAQVGESRIELLEAMAEESVIGRFVARRGEGMHHVAVRVDSVEAEFERLHGAGVRMVSDAVKVGAGGHRYFFVHPASTGGVLLEVVGA
jgi:LAO/AO transport system kinase